MKDKKFGKDFILVVIGQIISLFGNAILCFALPLYLLRQTNSPSLFGIVTACAFLPMIVLSFLGGVLADRVNKRNIMVALDFFTAAVVTFLLLTLDKIPLVPLMMVILMVLYGISGAYRPAVQASIPALVSEENILSAGAIVNQVNALAGLLGPIIGGMLLAAFGITPILIISILCFLTSAIMEIFIHIPYEKRENSSGMFAIIKSDFQDSTRYMRGEKPILIKIIGLVCLFNLVLSAMINVGTPILIVETLGLGDELLGLSQGFLAFGGLCGGMFTAVFSHKLKLANAHLLLLLCSLCAGAIALPLLLNASPMTSFVVLTAACFGIMFLATVFSVEMIATVQRETPLELVGKVIALMMSAAMCAQPLGSGLYGIIFDRFADFSGVILLCVGAVSSLIALATKKLFENMAN
ncbi:MAG: MFS transporter [Oscillospiraceae bacterium]